MSKKGFTLTELLIVIVVIAILASISAVAYSGVQQRTYVAKAASVVDSATKILEMYRLDHGGYPDYSYLCFTASGSLPAENGFAANECDSVYGDTINEDFNNELKQYVGNMPHGVLPPVDYDDPDHGKGRLRSVIYVGAENGRADLFYMINGNYDCPRGYKDDWRGRGDMTVCYVALSP